MLDGIGDPNDYASKAQELGHKYLAITDHGKMNALVEHEKACKKYGIKPLFGVELYINNELETYEKDKRVRTKNNHMIALVQNKIGYKNLLKLNYISNKDASHFYYSNRITLNELYEHSKGLIFGTGCLASPITQTFIKDGKKASEDLFLEFKKKINFFVELQLNELVEEIEGLPQGQKTANDWLIELGEKYTIPIVITSDIHYLEKGQDYLQKIAMAIRSKKPLSEMNTSLGSKENYYSSIDNIKENNIKYEYNYSEKKIEEWCNNAEKIASTCDFYLPERKAMYLPGNLYKDKETLVKESINGLKEKIGENISKEYMNRLKKELEVLIRKGMSSYMLLVKDIFDFCKKEKIMRGPARGSSGGSLVAYALDITTLDPIRFNLMFERFLSEHRSPDYVYDYFNELEE